eukprot:scaffold89947_cov17-Tisochrysis_lutea.AAC.2
MPSCSCSNLEHGAQCEGFHNLIPSCTTQVWDTIHNRKGPALHPLEFQIVSYPAAPPSRLNHAVQTCATPETELHHAACPPPTPNIAVPLKNGCMLNAKCMHRPMQSCIMPSASPGLDYFIMLLTAYK